MTAELTADELAPIESLTLRQLRVDYGPRCGPNGEFENEDADEDVIRILDYLERLEAEVERLREQVAALQRRAPQAAAQALADLENIGTPVGWTAESFTEEGDAVARAIFDPRSVRLPSGDNPIHG